MRSTSLSCFALSLLVGLGASTARAQPLDVSWAELTCPATLPMDAYWGGLGAFDGERIALDRPGAIDLYQWDGTTATFELTLTATSGDATGFPDTLTIDHGRVIANARLAADGPAVYEFALGGSTWSQVARFTNPMPPLGDPLLSVPALSGTRLLIGQPYVYTARGGVSIVRSASEPFTWTNGNSTRVVGTADYELTGQALAIDGADVAVSTLRGAAGGVSQTGVVRVYHDSGSSLDLLFRVDNPTPGSDDQFGVSVDLDANGLYVGAHYDDTMATDAGAVYVFDRTTGALRQTIYGNVARGRFGTSMRVSGDLMAVGAVGNATLVGTLFLYTRDASGMWQLRNTIPHLEGHVGTYFGTVQLVGRAMVVASPGETVGSATNAGRVWVATVSEPDGGACDVDAACTHGHCVGGICCATACAACGTCGGGTCDPSACDAGTPLDAGTDAGTASVDDAGADASTDASTDAGTGRDGATSVEDAAGTGADGSVAADAGGVPRIPLSCTCRASTRGSGGLALLGLATLLGVSTRRRRR